MVSFKRECAFMSNLVAYLSRYDSTDTRSVNSIWVPPLPDAHFESIKQSTALEPKSKDK